MGRISSISPILIAALAVAAPLALTAAPPPTIQAYTVPWVPASPASPHYSWSGKQITLKGTANVQDTGGGNIQFDWNPGDGGTHCTGIVTNMYIIECPYTYSGSVGQLFNATLTVFDTNSGPSGGPYSNTSSAPYYTALFNPPPSLQTETNAAIDAGLWYLHKDMDRYAAVGVTGLVLTNGGSGYESDGVTAPVVSFSGCASSPTATAVVDNGSPGVGGPGVITSLVLNSPGSGCIAPVTVTITDPIPTGVIQSLTVVNGGSGYELLYGPYYVNYYGYAPNSPCCNDDYLTFSGAGGSGDGNASGYANVNANSGAVTGVGLYNGGSGYINPVTVTVNDGYCVYADGYYYTGCGSGAVVTATATTNIVGSGATATVTVTAPTNLGDWSNCIDNATACNIPASGVTAANCTAFEVSGHLEGGPAGDPYTDDVARCILGIYSRLMSTSISSSKTNTFGAFNPDQNGNGLGVTITEANDMYQDGMIMDAIVATGTPNHAVGYGTLTSLTHPGGGAYTYGDTIMDMTDYYVYCETDAGNGTGDATTEGSWRYTCNSGQDNSVAQWAAIGMIGARRNFGSAIPTDALSANQAWLTVSQANLYTSYSTNENGNGYFGYGGPGPIWGPYADTPSGMVQMAMNGIGRGSVTAAGTQWDYAETFMRDTFDNPQVNDPTSDVKDYYYGMFSFTKSMLLHDSSGTGTGDSPIQFLHSQDNSGTYPDIDWYAAQNAAYGGSDTSNGVARTLISGTPGNGVVGQNSDGSWSGHYYDPGQGYFTTAWAIIMLNHTVFQQVPTACATYTPNPATDHTQIQLNGQCSTENNPAPAAITSWQWDVSGTAPYTNYTLSGVKVNPVLTAPVNCTLPCSYQVGLKVTDSLGLSSSTVITVVLNNPAGAAPPSANAGGPYNFCPNEDAHNNPIYTPWFLNGSGSTQSNGFAITAYDWDFNCSGTFTDAHGVQPRVDAGSPNLFNHNPTPFNVCLRVTNNTGIPQDATAQASAQVTVHSPTDAQCTHCIVTQSAKAKNFSPGVHGSAQIYWIDTNNVAFPIHHFNVYRSTNADFSSFVQVAGASGALPAIPAQAGGGEQLVLIDNTVPAPSSAPYYYRIAPATQADVETCLSPITLGVTVGGRQ